VEVKSSKILSENIQVNSLSIGDSGKGKTYFAGTICDHGKPFVIDAEGGLGTICDKDFDYVAINSYEELEQAYGLFMQTYKEKGYTHLVIDSITRLQQYLAFRINKDGKLTQAQWGEVLATLRKMTDGITKQLKEKGIHLHMTAMAMESKDELTGQTKIFPNIQGAFKFDLAGYFDIVLYHDCAPGKDKEGKPVTKYWVQTEGDTRITARSRYNSIKKLNRHEISNYSIIANIYGGK
jgi:hypothetical protein